VHMRNFEVSTEIEDPNYRGKKWEIGILFD